MKIPARMVVGGLMVVAVVWGVRLIAPQATAQQPAGGTKKPVAPVAPAKVADPRAKELAVLQQSAQGFAKAFNDGNAKAVAAMWTKDGDYTNDQGEVFAGPAAIEKEYAAFFAANKGAKITLAIENLKLLSDSAALEDGRAVVEIGDKGDATASEYTIVHVKVDGKWLMASVRDTHVDSISSSNDLDDLDWLVGMWTAEEGDQKMEVACRWLADKSFLERSYSLKKEDKPVTSGVQIIGWNPQAGHIQSWNFSSDGGHAIGAWSPIEGGWTIDSTGMMADGTPTTAVNLFTRVDDDSFSWQSTNREADGATLPDTPAVVLKRNSKE